MGALAGLALVEDLVLPLGGQDGVARPEQLRGRKLGFLGNLWYLREQPGRWDGDSWIVQVYQRRQELGERSGCLRSRKGKH
jgi:hypothetical protein